VAAITPDIIGIAIAAMLISAGIAISTPTPSPLWPTPPPQAGSGKPWEPARSAASWATPADQSSFGAVSPAGLPAALLTLAGAITVGALTTWRRADHPRPGEDHAGHRHGTPPALKRE